MSKKKRSLTAAGAVVLDGRGDDARVLVVHRPAYDDWSLPKGKPEPDEDLCVAASREVAEETGVKIRLGMPLGATQYLADGRPKSVHWWLGFVVSGEPHDGTPEVNGGREVDAVEWWPAARALQELSYPDERGLLARALELRPGHTILLVRHAKAMLRKNWTGKDWRRPLSGRGRRQAKRLAPLLDAYGVRFPVTSSSTRCQDTFKPFAKLARVDLIALEDLSEEAWEDHPESSRRTMIDIVNRARSQPNAPIAICGHRPLLPMMQDALGLPKQSMLVAEAFIVHHDERGNQVAVERVKSAF